MATICNPGPMKLPRVTTGSLAKSSGWLASLGVLSGFGAACGSSVCTIPTVLAGFGIGSGLMAQFDAFRLPMLVVAALMTTGGWRGYLLRRRADAGCIARIQRSRLTLLGLVLSSALLVAAVGWDQWIEPQLMYVIE
jgi:hypothetical protein